MPVGVYKRTMEMRKNMSLAHKGVALSFEHRKSLSKVKKGKSPKNLSSLHSLSVEAESRRRRNISLGKKGVKHPEQSGAKSYNWKGDNVGYQALHSWVNRMLGKPCTCEHCGKTGLVGKHIQWANKSQEYKRDITDWLRLCVPCHRNYDYSFNKLNI